jgi:hypothetical protein
VDLILQNNQYSKVKLLIKNDLCIDALIGHDIMKLHTAVNIEFGGTRAIFSVCNFACALVELVRLFQYSSDDFHPIVIKFRSYYNDDELFIRPLLQG